MCIQVLVSSWKNTNHIGVWPTLISSLALINSLKTLFANILKFKGLGFQCTNLGEDIVQSMTEVLILKNT